MWSREIPAKVMLAVSLWYLHDAGCVNSSWLEQNTAKLGSLMRMICIGSCITKFTCPLELEILQLATQKPLKWMWWTYCLHTDKAAFPNTVRSLTSLFEVRAKLRWHHHQSKCERSKKFSQWPAKCDHKGKTLVTPGQQAPVFLFTLMTRHLKKKKKKKKKHRDHDAQKLGPSYFRTSWSYYCGKIRTKTQPGQGPLKQRFPRLCPSQLRFLPMHVAQHVDNVKRTHTIYWISIMSATF